MAVFTNELAHDPSIFQMIISQESAQQVQLRKHAVAWALHDIVTTNIVWCMAYLKRGRGGVVYCAIAVQ